MGSDNKQRKLLIVDDVAHLREAIAYEFEDNGYAVLQADCGEAAIKVLKDNAVDLVLSDVRMPNGNGLELLDAIKKNNPNQPPVLFFSAYCDISEETAFASGIEWIFPKPFDLDEIKEVINSVCQGRLKMWDQPASNQHKNLEVHLTALLIDGRDRIPDGAKNNEEYAFLGRGGIFLPTKLLLASKNELLDFHLSFKEGPLSHLNFIGKIQWKRLQEKSNLYGGWGIRFIQMNQETAENIIALTTQKDVISYIPLGKK